MLLFVGTITSLALLVRILANPLANVFQKKLTHQSADPLFVTAVTYTGLFIACLFVYRWETARHLRLDFWANALLMGVLAVLGNTLLVKALQTGDLSVLGPINAYKAVVSLVVGVVLLGEVPSVAGLLGVGLIVAGSYVVLQPKRGAGGGGWRLMGQPEIRWRVLALICSAVEAVYIKRAVLLADATTVFVVWCALGCVLSWGWYGSLHRSTLVGQWQLVAKHRLSYLALIALVGLMQLSTTVVFSGMQVGYALALFQTSAVVSVLFGYQFFGERQLLPKLLGATIMAIGAALIVLVR
ncbi:protein of unknown function DUF6 transmembrane [Fibrella aestuarina BUZ 2]|uniref:EamA domain-containing protein n=1 Tax=Fibrella aestuarina BUZ 2 TaxID=1166018 RepID=I0KBC0_9BACT|nr:EamA family transporter [Fibrella aestuarina]CCH01423.1 protein of unknown function DUF6 transmembrane [Fibrella aestuarina BUZ 2]